jgi:hypothetical protein
MLPAGTHGVKLPQSDARNHLRAGAAAGLRQQRRRARTLFPEASGDRPPQRIVDEYPLDAL